MLLLKSFLLILSYLTALHYEHLHAQSELYYYKTVKSTFYNKQKLAQHKEKQKGHKGSLSE